MEYIFKRIEKESIVKLNKFGESEIDDFLKHYRNYQNL
jgi:hypothetical protein